MFGKNFEFSRTQFVAVRLMDAINDVGRYAIPGFTLAPNGFRLVVSKTDEPYHGKIVIDRIAGWPVGSTIFASLLPKDGWFYFEKAAVIVSEFGCFEFYGEDRGCDTDYRSPVCWIKFRSNATADALLATLIRRKPQVGILYETRTGFPEPASFFPTFEEAQGRIRSVALGYSITRLLVGADNGCKEDLKAFLDTIRGKGYITGTVTEKQGVSLYDLTFPG